VDDDLQRFVNLAATAKLTRLQTNIARRVSSSNQSERGLELLSNQLASSLETQVAENILTGILQGVEGRRNLAAPQSWEAVQAKFGESDSRLIRKQLATLAVAFNDRSAMNALRQIALNQSALSEDRSGAIETLVSQRYSGFDQDLIQLLADTAIRPSVLKGLAVYDHPSTPQAILAAFGEMKSVDKQNALLTLASREAWAIDLITAIENGRVAPQELTAFAARQILALENERLTERLRQVWGEVRETPKDRAKKIADIKVWLTGDVLAQADLVHGESLFKKQCASCHRFFGEGGAIGPDITGAQRNNLDYMLENIMDPSASVANDYRMEILQTVEGRIVTGLVEMEGGGIIAIQTTNERIVLPVEDVVARKVSSVSIMPDGLLEPLSDSDIRDLFGYLRRQE
jgi:putative heme-binding domain-containing protein